MLIRRIEPADEDGMILQSDIFEVNLELEITNGTALLPRELYDCVEATVLPVPKLEVHLRSHEAFMGRSFTAP